jgi:2-keto-4-pentenoate hydratase/2-oxohepta-3-ene-1,7-dioic acid hydratase in catechol pathway
MKLARYRESAAERWGIVNDEGGTIRPIRGAFHEWAATLTANENWVPDFAGEPVPLASVQLLAPRPARGEVVWVALNYPAWPRPADSEPPIFFKPKSAIIGTGETFLFPKLLKAQTQCYFCYEIELVAVMGSGIRDIEHASRDVLGYTVGLSGCLRHVRVGAVGIDLVALRCGEKTSALGPWITTRDELESHGSLSLDLTTRVNGQITQSFNTAEMIWDIDRLLYEVGHRLHLHSGDVVYTGTGGYVGVPDGVFQPGDTLEAEISRIGVLKNSIEKNDPYVVHPSQRWGGEGRVPGIYPAPEWRRV